MSNLLIPAPYQVDSFGTTGTAKFTWTPTAGTNWSDSTATTNPAVAFVDKVQFYLWGAQADKTTEEPYKTMNTWYTTNKAAIDQQALNSKLQVGAWAIYIDLQRNIKDDNMRAPPAAGGKA